MHRKFQGGVMEKLLKEIGERVRKARLAKGMSQAQLAEALNISPPYVSNIETGKHIMKITTLIKLTEALGVSNDWILRNATREADEYTSEEFDQLLRDCSPSEKAHLMKLLMHLKESIRDAKSSDTDDT